MLNDLSDQLETAAGEDIRQIKTEEDLAEYLWETFGVRIPDRVVCEHKGHVSPWRAFCDAYFARHQVVVWKASRGLGGKTFLLATLALVEAVTLKADVAVLGGSGEQSARVLETMEGHWNHPGAPRRLLASEPAIRKTKLIYGNKIEALMASQRSVRGPHPQRLRLDEIDEMDKALLDASTGQTLSKRGIATQTVMSSTHHNAGGTFDYVLQLAVEKGWPIYEWCYEETLQPHGWLSPIDVTNKRSEMTAMVWENEVELQEPSPENRAILPEKVDQMFQIGLGEFEGRPDEYIEIEPPAYAIDPKTGKLKLVGVYSTGADWAKSVDWTVIWTFRVDVYPVRLVAYRRTARRPWPDMVGFFDEQVRHFPGSAAHDATGLGSVVDDLITVEATAVTLVARARDAVFSNYIKGIENGDCVAPRIKYAYNEHKFVSRKDLHTSAGHPPDTFVAGALAWIGASANIAARAWIEQYRLQAQKAVAPLNEGAAGNGNGNGSGAGSEAGLILRPEPMDSNVQNTRALRDRTMGRRKGR